MITFGSIKTFNELSQCFIDEKCSLGLELCASLIDVQLDATGNSQSSDCVISGQLPGQSI